MRGPTGSPDFTVILEGGPGNDFIDGTASSQTYVVLCAAVDDVGRGIRTRRDEVVAAVQSVGAGAAIEAVVAGIENVCATSFSLTSEQGKSLVLARSSNVDQKSDSADHSE